MVNTFLPYANFAKCAKVLDNKRLGKQRVEAKQILNILTGETKKQGWINHPAVRMWASNVQALKLYYNAIVMEWIERGFINNMPLYVIKPPVIMPWFIGNKSFHYSFQANLLRKNKSYYRQFFHKVPKKYIRYTYIWPGKLTPEQMQLLDKNRDKVLDIALFATKVSK